MNEISNFTDISATAALIVISILLARTLETLLIKAFGKINGGNGGNGYVADLRNKIDDLWDWHNMHDKDGVKIWYVRPSLGEAIADLSKVMEMQTKVLDKINTRLENLEAKITGTHKP